MNAIKETAEMTKYQKQARAEFENNKAIDVAAVLLGWKIGPGKFDNNVAVSPDGSKTVTILAEVSDRMYKVDFNGQEKQIDAYSLAKAIVAGGWKVGCSL